MDFVIETWTHLWCGTLSRAFSHADWNDSFSFPFFIWRKYDNLYKNCCSTGNVVLESSQMNVSCWATDILLCYFLCDFGLHNYFPQIILPFSHCWLNLGVDVQTDTDPFCLVMKFKDLVTFVRACHQWFRCRTQLALH